MVFKITEEQYDALVLKIYSMLMDNPQRGMGDMGNCQEAAECLVNDWCDENKIERL